MHHHGHHHAHGGHDFVEANRSHHDAEFASTYAESALNVWLSEKAAEAILRSYAFKEEETTVLDFACGGGLISQQLSAHCKQIVGVDLSSHMVAVFNKAVSDHGIDSSEMIAYQKDELKDEAAELSGELFDVVFCAQAYHHIPDVDAVTAALSRRVKPGGVLLVLDLDAESDWGDMMKRKASKKQQDMVDAVVAHKGGFTKQSLTSILERAGRFSNISVEVSHEATLSQMQSLKGKANWATEIDSSGRDLTIKWLIAKGVRKTDAE